MSRITMDDKARAICHHKKSILHSCIIFILYLFLNSICFNFYSLQVEMYTCHNDTYVCAQYIYFVCISVYNTRLLRNSYDKRKFIIRKLFPLGKSARHSRLTWLYFGILPSVRCVNSNAT